MIASYILMVMMSRCRWWSHVRKSPHPRRGEGPAFKGSGSHTEVGLLKFQGAVQRRALGGTDAAPWCQWRHLCSHSGRRYLL